MKNVHQKMKEHKCGKCNYSTTENLKLENHLQFFHKESLILECGKCPYKANNVNVMTRHIDTIHRSKTEGYNASEIKKRS